MAKELSLFTLVRHLNKTITWYVKDSQIGKLIRRNTVISFFHSRVSTSYAVMVARRSWLDIMNVKEVRKSIL